jgi:hypothetical protein
MDHVAVALGVSIVVVLVLLYSCSGKNNKKSSKRNKRLPRQRRNNVDVSEYGTGVSNRASADRYRNTKNVVSYDDYNELAQYMSVDPEVYESHARYTADMNRGTSGPSMMAERDDPNDVVPWVGLRKPKYQDVYASPEARQEHSEIPDQMRKNTYYILG